MGPVIPDGADHDDGCTLPGGQNRPENNDGIILCASNSLPCKAQGFVQGNVQDGVGRFELGAGGVEKLVHLIGNPGDPILKYGA